MHKNNLFRIKTSILIVFLIFVSAPFCRADVKLKPYQDYIKKYAPDAMRQQIKYGVPASITLAQGLLESNAGNSELAKKSNNHFGIKCHSSWNGPSVKYFDDGEMSCFRKYRRVLDSYTDHSLFLVDRPRYDFLFELNVKDYKAWARGLKKAGYATDKQYANKLIRLIELYDLNEYTKIACNPRKARRLMRNWDEVASDAKPAAKPAAKPTAVEAKEKSTVKAESPSAKVEDLTVKVEKPKKVKPEKPAKQKTAKQKPEREERAKAATQRLEAVQQAKDYQVLVQSSQQEEGPRTITAENSHTILYKGTSPYIVARFGDNYKTLANEFNISPSRLRQINEVPKNYQIKPGDLIFLNKKMSVWEGESATHTVRTGDSMHSIAQQYGLRLKALYELNGMAFGDPIYVGQELKLR